MNELDLFNTEIETITSKEICELTGRRHDHTLRFIRSMIKNGMLQPHQFMASNYIDSAGEKQLMYKIYRRSAIEVIARQSPEIIARLVERRDELEKLIAE